MNLAIEYDQTTGERKLYAQPDEVKFHKWLNAPQWTVRRTQIDRDTAIRYLQNGTRANRNERNLLRELQAG